MMKRLSVIFLLCASAAAAWYFQRPPETREASGTDIVTAGLGGFRGLISEVVWFRADKLQNEGRYSEMAQLATLLTTLEPRTPEVWSYAAWNLAYNISVMMPTGEDRWRWVEAALRLLRDDGLRLNPGSPEIHKEIAWLFLSKIGGVTDTAVPVYTARWGEEVESAGGDWEKLKMDPSLVAHIDSYYGRQDWRDPKASALYWAHRGLALKPTGAVRAELRQAQYQTLMMQSLKDASVAPKALRAMREAYAESPSRPLKELIVRYRQRFSP